MGHFSQFAAECSVTKGRQNVIGSEHVRVRVWSNKVHPATAEMLMKYPVSELREYARDLGLKPERLKQTLAFQLAIAGATICGGLGN